MRRAPTRPFCLPSAVTTLVLVLASLGSPSQARALPLFIDFNDGFRDLASAYDAYEDIGLLLPSYQFFNSSLAGHVPFFYGSDDWGITRDAGTGQPAALVFLSPVDYIEVDARAQAAFDLDGEEPFTIWLIALDADGNEVASTSVSFGLDLIVPRPPEDSGGDYPLGARTIRLDATGLISKVVLTSDRKVGIDGLRYDYDVPTTQVPQAPEPGSLLLLVPGLAALGMIRRRRN